MRSLHQQEIANVPLAYLPQPSVVTTQPTLGKYYIYIILFEAYVNGLVAITLRIRDHSQIIIIS